MKLWFGFSDHDLLRMTEALLVSLIAYRLSLIAYRSLYPSLVSLDYGQMLRRQAVPHDFSYSLVSSSKRSFATAALAWSIGNPARIPGRLCFDFVSQASRRIAIFFEATDTNLSSN